ncbi:MAG: RidA family protein, partial [Planctomycetota bacterium]
MPGPHELINAEGLMPAIGFSHAVRAAPGRTIWLGGQDAEDAEGRISGATIPEQFERVLANLVTALAASGARAEHLVSMQIFVTSASEYRAARAELGRIWQRHLGKHYPAMALFEVEGLFHPDARV